MLRNALVIALIALIVSACCSSRQVAVSRSADLRINESTDVRSRDSVVVAVHDTIMETTTIVVDRNETGDTLKLSTVTERDRVRDRAQVKDQHERIVMKTDTVFVATRDSSYITNTDLTNRTNERSGFVYGVKWLVALVAAVIVLVIVLKFSFLGKRFV